VDFYFYFALLEQNKNKMAVAPTALIFVLKANGPVKRTRGSKPTRKHFFRTLPSRQELAQNQIFHLEKIC